MTPREQGKLESDGQVSRENCTHFYRGLTWDGSGENAVGYTCSNPKCGEFFPNESCEPYKKSLDITNVAEAKHFINDLKLFGDGDTWVLLCKASSDRQGWMKSTKVMNVPGGCVIQVTTQEQSNIAEAVTYVPGVHIDTTTRELFAIVSTTVPTSVHSLPAKI